MGTGALITRSIEDVDRVGDVINTLLSALSAIPFTMILGTALAFRKDWVLALILFAFVPVILAVVLLVSRRIHPLWKISDEYMDKQNALIRSRLSGIRVVRAFNREGAEQQKIDRATHVMADNIIKANIRAGLISPVCMLVLNLVTVLILYVGAYRLSLPDSRLTAGGILAVIEYVGMIMSGIMNISFTVSEIPRAKVNCMRISEVLTADSVPETRAEGQAPLKGGIRLKGVSYRYPGASDDALSGIDMEILPGQKIAFIGGTGSGKSTVGVVLAKRLGRRFVDSDLVIQERHGKLLHELITEHGVEGFWQIESNVNASLNLENSIIATGGSACYEPEGMQHLRDISTVVYLKLPYEEVEQRLGDLNARGVTLQPGQTLRDLYEERTPLYEKYADLIIDCNRKMLRDVVAEIAERYKKQP